MTAPSASGIRLAELLASLSLAIDLGLGQPIENLLQTCLVAVRLGESLGQPDAELSDCYYLCVLRYLGCTADSLETSALFGDEVAMNSWMYTVVQGGPLDVMGALLRNVGADEPPLQRLGRLAALFAAMPTAPKYSARVHCEAAQLLAARLGFSPSINESLGMALEQWDGKGRPAIARGEQLPRPLRVAQVAQDAATFYRIGGTAAAVEMVRQRSGGALDPSFASHFCDRAGHLLAGLDAETVWDAALAAEPGPTRWLTAAGFETACRAIGDFADLKMPSAAGHSGAVAALVVRAARGAGLPEEEHNKLLRAALLQDLGRVGISSAIWLKPAPLTAAEWERVRLHPYYTERVLSRSPALAAAGRLASSHHERLDGSGYHGKLPAAAIPVGAKLLAAADVYQALIEERPYRPARSATEAADELGRQVRSGLLDSMAVDAVLDAAGHRVRRARRTWPAGLSGREVEVLRLMARGLGNRGIAERIVVSERTVHHHVEHIYNKLDVSTRAAATLYALQHDLLTDLTILDDK